MHGLKALKSGYRDDEELTGKNVEVAYVTRDGWTQLEEGDINTRLNQADEFDPEDQMQVE
jgi:20S proteasome alpha/beta subunit